MLSKINPKRCKLYQMSRFECFQYNYMQHQKQEKANISRQPQCQNPGAKTLEQQTHQIVAKDEAEDEAKRKLIAKSILSSSMKRLRRDQQQSDLMQEYMNQVRKMVGQLRFTRPSKLIRKDMPIEQIDALIEQLKERMENNVNRNNLKKKNILEMMQRLESKELQNKEINQKLMKVKAETTQKKAWLQYMMQVEERISELEKDNIKIQQDIQSKELQLHVLKQQIARKVSESAITKQKIEAQRKNIQGLLYKQSQIQRLYMQSLTKKIPYRREMIHCMFQVGILSEQNYVYSLKKKHKWSEKDQPFLQSNEKFLKMYENIKERIITIDCYKSLLIHIRTLSEIYIHCQSLAMGRSFISNYSYFSAQYKVLYNYQFYERYLNILIEKTRHNQNWTKMRDELHQVGITACKLKIVIYAREEQVEFLRSIMQVFLEESGYYIHLGEVKMNLELKADMNNKEEDQQQMQICRLKIDLQNLGS